VRGCVDAGILGVIRSMGFRCFLFFLFFGSGSRVFVGDVLEISNLSVVYKAFMGHFL